MTFEDIKKRLEKISKLMNLSEKEIEILLKFKRIIKKELEVDGKTYEAWRIVHNDSLGPGKGGIRFHPNVSEDEIKSLAFWMSLKTSLVELPFGGSKGGIRVDPKELTEKEIEKLSRIYIRNFHEVLGQDKDIPAPDVYTNQQIMGFMLDEFEKMEGRHEPGMITGKPFELGGCVLRDDATSRGGEIILNLFLERMNKKPEETRVVIQGFGNAGMNVAKMLYEQGYSIIGVSDSKGGIFDEEGIDIEKMIKIKKEKGSVIYYSNAKISNKDLLELETDVLILAALENQITEKNADDVKAKYILELANGPVTSEGEEILQKKGIIVIPDILANAGGVIVSYCEWVNNRVGHIFSKKFMEEILKEKICRAFHKTYELYEEQKTETFTMRDAAYIIAIKRILKAEKARGNI